MLPVKTRLGTHTPQPVDHFYLLVQLHHEDDEEDDGDDHFAGGHSDVGSKPGSGIADDDEETEDLSE